MTQPALIDAVQQQAAAAIAALWAEVRAEADRARDDADRAIAQHRDQHAAQLQAASAAARREANAEAAARSRAIRAEAKAAMADRLRTLAASTLTQLRDEAYPRRFAALADELPHRQWLQLDVHPADVALAQARFPGCLVRPNAEITGGLIAADDQLTVDNTFERRLASAWPELLPEVMTDVVHVLERSHTAA